MTAKLVKFFWMKLSLLQTHQGSRYRFVSVTAQEERDKQTPQIIITTKVFSRTFTPFSRFSFIFAYSFSQLSTLHLQMNGGEGIRDWFRCILFNVPVRHRKYNAITWSNNGSVILWAHRPTAFPAHDSCIAPQSSDEPSLKCWVADATIAMIGCPSTDLFIGDFHAGFFH